MTKLQILKTKFGAHVREIRKQKGMSQQDVANNCNMDKAWISRIETGQKAINIGTIFELSKGLGVTAAQLVDFTD